MFSLSKSAKQDLQLLASLAVQLGVDEHTKEGLLLALSEVVSAEHEVATTLAARYEHNRFLSAKAQKLLAKERTYRSQLEKAAKEMERMKPREEISSHIEAVQFFEKKCAEYESMVDETIRKCEALGLTSDPDRSEIGEIKRPCRCLQFSLLNTTTLLASILFFSSLPAPSTPPSIVLNRERCT
uniref:Uncharacterized protein n=1 Tax=Palpitomonas bilix TaxID=652834 RepID=A0A7S3GEX1_9EUKA|mmetsp:Transcript_46422/g.119818  ORF Transcript_46422/g.119818 Transcript_46422/m.119818 type:complete len:184 (+) Transcript_46422:113-664(+)